MCLHDFADAGNLAHVERREELGLFAGNNPEHSVGLGLRRRNFGDEARGSDPDGTVQSRVTFHAQMQSVRGFQWRSVQAFGAGHVEIGFVDGGHLNLRRKRAEDFVNLFRTLAVALGMAVDEDRLRAHLRGGAQRHGGMHSELARFIRSCGDDAALVALSADDHCLAFQRWIEQFLHRDEERVHVDVEDGASEGELAGGSHAASNFSSGFVVSWLAQSEVHPSRARC